MYVTVYKNWRKDIFKIKLYFDFWKSSSDQKYPTLLVLSNFFNLFQIKYFVENCSIENYKYELPHKSANKLRFGILGN